MPGKSPNSKRAYAPESATDNAPAQAATSRAGKRAYADALIAQAKKLQESSAFAPATQHDLATYNKAHAARVMSQKSIRITIALGVVLVVVLSALCLCLPYYGVNTMGAGGVIYTYHDVLDGWWLWAQLNIGPLFDSTISSRAGMLLNAFEQEHPGVVYQLIVQRGAVTLVVIACGVLLAVSGMLFQTAFRNPLATPTMLGVSDGVTLGCIVFAFMGFSSAGDNLPLYLVLVYGMGAAAVVAVIVLSRVVSGKGFTSIFDMLLLGTVLCQLLGGINSYVSNFGMEIDTWERFYELQQAGNVLNYPQTWIVVAVVFVVTIVPVVVLRFKFNLLSFNDEEGSLMGARMNLLRGGALVLGSIMQLAALASIGQVAMLSLAVPFLVRYLMPSDFRYQLLGNIILGVVVLLACVGIQHFAIVGYVTVPVGTIVSVLVVPFFVWAVAMQSSRWGD